MGKFYDVTLVAEFNITADDEDDAVRYAQADLRDANMHPLDYSAGIDFAPETEETFDSPWDDADTRRLSRRGCDWIVRLSGSYIVEAETQSEAVQIAEGRARRDLLDEPEDEDAETITVELSGEQRDVILAALRLWQRTPTVPEEILDIARNGRDIPLSDGDIDDLCETINVGGEG